MFRVIKDLTPSTQDLADPRPWYEKHWPYKERGHKIKIISALEGWLGGKESSAERVMTELIAFLAPRVSYDLEQKLFVVEEVLKKSPSKKKTYAKLTSFRDTRGRVIPAECHHRQVKNGEYLLAHIELFTDNWPRFSMNSLEKNLAHELLHIIDPKLGTYVKNGCMWENERIMKKATIDVLRAMKHKNKKNAQRD